MSPATFQTQMLGPGLRWLEGVVDIPYSQSANRFLLAIMMQESGLEHRYQLTNTVGRAGPARGWAQFERAGGVRGVMRHSKTRGLSRRLCEACHVANIERPIWRAMEGHDRLAVGFARLLLWTSPKALPVDAEDGWTQYAKDLWRPGKPHPDKWEYNWNKAGFTVEQYINNMPEEQAPEAVAPPISNLLLQAVDQLTQTVELRLQAINIEIANTNRWLDEYSTVTEPIHYTGAQE